MHPRSLPTALAALAFVLSAALIVPAFHYPVSDDAFFELVGREMVAGRMLYAGIWDNKPPPIYLMNALLQFIFGDRYLLHRVAEYAVTLGSIVLFALIARRGCPRLWGAATLSYAVLVSWPTMAFLNYSQQYAMLPLLGAILCASRRRPISAGLLHAVAFLFWQPTILVAAALFLWLGSPRRFISYVAAFVATVVLGVAATLVLLPAAAIRTLLHDMLAYESLRTHVTTSVVTDVRQRFLAAVLRTGVLYPLIALLAVLKRPTTPGQVAAVTWFLTAFLGALANLNFSDHYFYPVIAPTVYAGFVFGETSVWRWPRLGLAAVAGLVALLLVPRSFALMRAELEQNRIEVADSARIADAVQTYVPVGGQILVYGYLPGVYLRADRSASGRFANYLALRPDTVAPADRLARLATYDADIERSAAFVQLASDALPASVERIVDARFRRVCATCALPASIYVEPALAASGGVPGRSSVARDPAPEPSPSPVNYPSPLPQWPNALALKTLIDPVKAAQHIKRYDADAMRFYSSWNPSYRNIWGGVPGWFSTSNYAITSGPGAGFYIASASDPTYTVLCQPHGFCGYSTLMTDVHVPAGARTQNSGQKNCDCHLYVLEPVGWKPGSLSGFRWPALKPPLQYEIDIEDAATSEHCAPPASVACTTFDGGGTIYGFGIAAFSTGSTGWYGGSGPTNDGFSPANRPPGKWDGSADKTNTPFTALAISAQDLLQGEIDHETALGLVCSEAPQPDVWPSSVGDTDYSCHDPATDGYHKNLGATGWSYGDHIWLDRTPSEIMADVQDHTLTPVQGILARSFARYGAVVFDNAGPFGPTFQLNTTSGDPAWSEVATKYGLKTINATLGGVVSEGVLLNLALPLDYMKAHAHAIDACVIRKTC